MDTKQLITIVVTAVITATAKELVTWLITRTPSRIVALAKTLAPTIMDWARRYPKILADLVGIIVSIVWFALICYFFPVLSHVTVFVIAQTAGSFIYCCNELGKDIAAVKRPNEQP